MSHTHPDPSPGKAAWPIWVIAGGATLAAAAQLGLEITSGECTLIGCLPGMLSALVAIAAIALGVRHIRFRKHLVEDFGWRALEARYRALFEESPNGMAIVNVEGRYEIVNDAFARLLGRTCDEIEGLLFRDLMRPEDVSRCETAVVDLFAGTIPRIELEKRYVHKDGSDVWTLTHCALRRDAKGNPAYILSEVIDYRERRAMEDRLRESEARHRALAEVTSDYTYRVELGPKDGKLAWVTESFEKIMGCALAEFNRIGGAPALVEPEYLDDLFARRADVRAGKTVEATVPYRTVDGRRVWLHTINRPHIDQRTGEIIGVIGAARDVTARVEAEQAQQESERRLELALRGADLGLWDRDIKTNRMRVNERWATMLGWRLDEIDEDVSEWTSRIHSDDRHICECALAAHFAGIMPQYEAEYRMRRKDGSWCWVLDRGRVVEWDKDGSPLRAAGTHLDITESKKATQALEESEQRFQHVMDATNDAIFDWDLTTNEVWRNDRYAELFSIGAEVGDDITWWEEHVHPDDLPRCLEGVRTAIDSNYNRWSTEYRFDRGDGQWRDVVDLGVIVRDEYGKAIRIIGAMSDITERKRDEAAIRRSEARYRAVSELTSDFVFHYSVRPDGDAQLDWITDSFTKLLGYTAMELPDPESLLRIVHPEDRDEFAQRLRAAIAGDYQHAEHRFIARTGRTLRLSWVAGPEMDEHEGVVTGVIGAGRDVSELRKSEEALDSIAAGVSEDVGEAFFESLVNHLAQALDVQFAIVGELNPDAPEFVRAIAVSKNESLQSGVEYPLKGTPCETVLAGSIQSFTSDLQTLFPDDPDLVTLNAQSYIGVPLIASTGDVMGLLAVFDDKPMTSNTDRAETLLKVFASRAVAELERLRDEAALAASEERLELAVEGAELGLWDWDIRTGRLIINERWATMLGYERHELAPDLSAWESLVHPDDLPKAKEALEAHLVSGEQYCVEHRLRTSMGEWKWVLTSGKVVERDADGAPVRAAGTHADIEEAKRAERRQQRMMRELDHRVKNNLASVISIADCTLESASTMEEFRHAFVGRIKALSRVHQLLAVQRWDGVSLRELVTRTMEAFSSRDSGRVEISGPDMMLRPEAASPLCMSLHELSTNAAKYGALSSTAGAVCVSWERLVGDGGEEALRIDWLESGGPPITQAVGVGYGTELLRGLVAYELGGKATFDYKREGLFCRIDFPLDRADAIRNIADAEKESNARKSRSKVHTALPMTMIPAP